MTKDTPTQMDEWTHGQPENSIPSVANHHGRHKKKIL